MIQFQIMRNRKLCGFLLLLLLNISFLFYANSEEPLDYHSPENILKFADYLTEQGDYLRAAGEYQKYLFYQPQESVEIHYKIALCYRLGGKTEKAVRLFEKLLQESTDKKLVSSAYYQVGVSYFLMEKYGKLATYLEESLSHITDVRYRAETHQLIGLSYLMQNRWLEAEKVFNDLKKSDVLVVREKAAVYSKYATQGAKLPTRSPFLAGLMSTIVPGAGRLYTGRYSDALTSLVTVGFTGWQAYDGFRRDGLSSAKGWTLGTLSSIFYLGNIYGSVISAGVYNRHVAEEYLSTLFIEISF